MSQFSSQPVGNKRKDKCKDCGYNAVIEKGESCKISSIGIYGITRILSPKYIYSYRGAIIKPHQEKSWPGKELYQGNDAHFFGHIAQCREYLANYSLSFAA